MIQNEVLCGHRGIIIDDNTNIDTCFSNVRVAKEAEIHSLQKIFDTDPCYSKVNLTRYGALDTTYVNTWVNPLDEYSHKIPTILKLAKVIAEDKSLNKEYLPEIGSYAIAKCAVDIVLGKESPAVCQNRAFAIQTLSQVGALRVAGQFFADVLGINTFYYSDPTFGVFPKIFRAAGLTDSRTYRYWNDRTLSLDIDGFLEDLSNAIKGSIVILNVCGHNPTGCDPNEDQWKQIAKVMKEHNLFPVMDISYQGLISGDLDVDAWPVRYFVEQGFELFCIQTFSGNMGLFGDRVGTLIVVLESNQYMAPVKSQLAAIITTLYWNPPVHGPRLVTYLINDPDLFNQWRDHLKMRAARLIKIRRQFREALERTGTPGNWSHITAQTGLFSYTGLSDAVCTYLEQKFHVYMLKNGQISMLGLNSFNIDYVAKAICEAILYTKAHKKL